MKAHKVPATYYSSWNIKDTKHSFYVFYKSHPNEKGCRKSYRKVDKLTQEHAYFMAEDFYYLDINKIPGLYYKLKNEVNEFLQESPYKIKCKDVLSEDSVLDYPIIDITDYDKFMHCRENMDSWVITDSYGDDILIEEFKSDLSSYIFNKIGKIVEEDYFAKELEPKWNKIKQEIMESRAHKDDFIFINKEDFLEFFVIQYLRLDDVVINEISPVLNKSRELLASLGYDETELDRIEKKDGLLASESFFYGLLLDVARGNKTRIQRHINSIKRSYVLDLLKSSKDVSFITSTSPCVVLEMNGLFKAEMIFPISPQYCIRFISKSSVASRNGKYYEISEEQVKSINQKILSQSRNIVISEAEYISDKI